MTIEKAASLKSSKRCVLGKAKQGLRQADSEACAAVEVNDFAGGDDEPRETALAAIDNG
jgi:hypothetical protein